MGFSRIAGSRLNVDDIVLDSLGKKSDQNQLHIEEPLVVEQEPLPLLDLPQNEQPLRSEILEGMSQNLVTVIRSTKPGFEAHVPSGGNCQGFITLNFKNEPIVITALHCIPPKIVSAVDGNTYATHSKDGSIFNVQVQDLKGETYQAKSWNYFVDPLNQISNDLIVMQLFEQDLVAVPGLALNIAELKRGEVYYLVSLSSEGVMQVSAVHFLDSLQDENRFIDLGNSDPSCIPGTSGSAIVNSAGEVVSIVRASRYYELTGVEIVDFNLNPIHLGRVVRMCSGTFSSKILGLIS